MNHSTELNIDEGRTELQGFRDFYTREIEPQLLARKVRWRTARRRLLWFGPAGVVAAMIVGWMVFRSHGYGAAFIAAVPMVALTGMLSLGRIVKLGWSTKRILMGKVCRFFDFKYDEDVAALLPRGFGESGLVPPYDEILREDLIQGRHHGVEFDLAESRMWKRKWAALGWFLTTSEERLREPTGFRVKVYQGLLLRIRFPMQFNGRTWVVRNSRRVGKSLGNPGMDVKRVAFENAHLPGGCEVWSSDPLEARRLVTPAVWERGIQLAKAFGSDRLELCFLADQVLISVRTREAHFEFIALDGGVNDLRYVERLVNQICTVFDTVDSLQLALTNHSSDPVNGHAGSGSPPPGAAPDRA